MSFLTGLIGSIAGASGEWADREIKDRQTQEAEQRAYDQRVDLAKLQAQIEVEKANAIDVAKRARDELQRQSDAEAITAEAGRAGEERFQRNKVDLGYDDSADYDHPANAKSMEDVRQGIIGRATQGGSMDRLEAAARLGIESKPDQLVHKAQLDEKNVEEKLAQVNARAAANAEHEKRLREDATERNKAITDRVGDARIKSIETVVTTLNGQITKREESLESRRNKELEKLPKDPIGTKAKEDKAQKEAEINKKWDAAIAGDLELKQLRTSRDRHLSVLDSMNLAPATPTSTIKVTPGTSTLPGGSTPARKASDLWKSKQKSASPDA